MMTPVKGWCMMKVRNKRSNHVAIDDEKTSKTTTRAKKVVTAKALPVEPRNFLVAFLFTLLLGPLGLRHFYLGDRKLGWIRTGLFVGGYVWFFALAALNISALAGLGLLAVIVAGFWAIVDFFYVYNSVKVDASGQPLVATDRDRRWAKYVYVAVIVGFIASIVIATVAASVIEYQIKHSDWFQQRMHDDGMNFDGTDTQMREYFRQLQEQSQSDTQVN
jgi:hypothetical protein